VEWSSGSSTTTMWIPNTSVDQRRFLPFITNDVLSTYHDCNHYKSSYVADGLYQLYRKKEKTTKINNMAVQEMVVWNDDTIDYFKKMNKPGCEGEYVRAITDFVHHDCDWAIKALEEKGDSMDEQTLIEDLIIKTKR